MTLNFPLRKKLFKLNDWALFFFSILLWELALFHFTFFIWVVFIPIFLLLYKSTIQKAIGYSFLFSFLISLLTFWWTSLYSLEAFLVANFLVTSAVFLFTFTSRLCWKKINHPVVVFFPPIIWLSLQLLYSFSILNSYALDLAIFQPMLAPIIWVLGGYGVTFIILLTNSLLFFHFVKRTKKMRGTTFFIILLLFSSYVYSSTAVSQGKPIKVALIQGNFDESWKWRVEHAEKTILPVYLNLTKEAAKKGSKLIVWSEYAIPIDLEKNEKIRRELSILSQETNITLIVGSIRWVSNETEKWERERQDMAMIFSKDGTLQDYASINPIPFNRKVIPGTKQGFFMVDDLSLGVNICYEEFNSKLSKELVNKGSSVLISLSNNNHFDESRKGLYLASLYSRLRAAENGKYFLRSTNTGITQVTNPYGKVISKLEPNKRGFLIQEIHIGTG